MVAFSETTILNDNLTEQRVVQRVQVSRSWLTRQQDKIRTTGHDWLSVYVVASRHDLERVMSEKQYSLSGSRYGAGVKTNLPAATCGAC
ncbi:hypothetical protein RRG08_064854 [Elysia crispata]|uniref:Uncharacterized protein n=1 Tax=Elysia crispata TaxID=231223 RepID=A0AAE1DRW3_9GAST|nr:hypothetical protein RRG08_064854 [Elysia crispata]